MRILKTTLLALLAVFFVVAAIFLAVDGNLARLTGWYHYRPGMPMISAETASQLENVGWMRIEDLHDQIECRKDECGDWWIIKPFHDRLDPGVVRSILLFTANSKIVDTLPLNNTTRGSMREFGVETSPHTITLKLKDGKDSYTTVARYTLGSTSPWLADAEDGKGGVLPTSYLRTDFYGRDKRIHVVTGNILRLFRNGLEALRDSHPLLFPADELRHITIAPNDGECVKMHRASAEAEWVIAEPCLAAADQGQVDKLLSCLSRVTALRVEDAADVRLPEKPDCTITLGTGEKAQAAGMVLYPPFFSEKDGQQVRYATVAGRPVVFTLRDEPKVERRGSYSAIVGAVCKLPVLNEKAMAQVKMSQSGDALYMSDVPMTLPQLRSTRFADIDYKDVERIYLRSRFARHPLQVRLVPGDSDSGVADAWIFAAEGQPMRLAETEMVKQLVNGLRDIPVTGFLADIHPGEEAEIRRRFGLDAPTYVLVIAPRSCAYRATLFGHDLPLVRDHSPRAFYITRYTDPQSGKGAWVGMEEGGNSIYALSTKLTRNLSLQANRWKQRNLLSFPISALRKLTLGYQQAPLELEYDYIGESWTGTLKGEDISLGINTHRAEHYVRRLQGLRVDHWVSGDDEDAKRMLSNPVFHVSLDLEMTDYSDVESVVIESDNEDIDTLDDATAGNGDKVERLLAEDDATSKAMRDLALAERKTIKRTVTIEIAPMNNVSDTPPFYGRIRETGEMFVLSFGDAQGLAAGLLDM